MHLEEHAEAYEGKGMALIPLLVVVQRCRTLFPLSHVCICHDARDSKGQLLLERRKNSQQLLSKPTLEFSFGIAASIPSILTVTFSTLHMLYN